MTAKSLPADHGAILEMRLAKFALPAMVVKQNEGCAAKPAPILRFQRQRSERVSFPTVPIIIGDGEAAGDTGERIVLSDLVGEHSLQQLPDRNDL